MASEVNIVRISKAYGAFKAVDEVSLRIRQGSFVSLLGSSGAGKSTVLRMIGGFELPDTGRVEIGGNDVTQLPPYRRDVNTVFQNYALFPHMSAAENVAYGLRQDRVPAGERRKRVRDALDMVQMLSFAHRRPTELSGGQQQRIALARALVKRPSVLLLDEPLGALDRKLRQQMQIELKLLQAQLGLTFIFVTHDQEEALAMSDQIAIMRDGRIEQLGSPTELYDTPRTAFVASFIGAQNFLNGTRIADTNRLEAEGAQFTAGRVAEGLQPGAKALGAVRPEHVALTRDEPVDQPNRIAGQVAAVVMLGDALEYLIKLEGDRDLISRVQRGRAAGLPNTGEAVWASWDAAHFNLYPHEDLQVQSSRMMSN
ncbi:ABC transporter ATP-binding protein [Rhodoligotrophos ferricapiens]|uniref:ABC transporter ATP-binding protein n=1 Tax=Rhodoligotrophos ferricapiens TaxID=3069264 RepID=UPI00315C90D6